MALCPNDIKATSVEGLLAFHRNVGFDRCCAFGQLSFIGNACAFVVNPHLQIAAQLNVGTTSRHVCGDGDVAGNTCLGNDVGFLLVITGVEDIVFDVLLFEQIGKRL